jgi:membrane protein involved in colicin uptake
MHITKRMAGLALAAFVSVSVLAVSPAYARQGSDDSDKSAVSTTTSTTSGTSGSGETETETPKTTEDTKQNEQIFRQKAQQLIQTKRAEVKDSVKAKTADQRKKVCEERSKGIDQRFGNFKMVATRHFDALNATYTKLQAYQTDKKLDVANYDALVAAADAKKAAASDAIAALSTVATDIDCNSADPATSIATVKAAVKTVHDTLQAYRKSIKDVLVALMTAKGTAASSTGDTESDSTDSANSTTNTTTTNTTKENQ